MDKNQYEVLRHPEIYRKPSQPSWVGPVIATIVSLTLIYVGTLLYWAGSVNARMDAFDKRMGSMEETINSFFKPTNPLFRGPGQFK